MTIIILLLILVGAVFILRALFNAEWRNNVQAKIDGIKQERIFWRLVNGYEGIKFSINAIFTIHLDPRYFANFITIGDTRTERDKRVLKLIEGRRSFECIGILNTALEKAEQTVVGALKESNKSYTKEEVKKFFDTRKDELFVPEQYDKFVSFYLRFLPDHAHLKGTDIWEARKKLEEAAGKLEWRTEEEKVDGATLFAVKKSEAKVGAVVADILCGKSVTSGTLREALTDWEHIQMLRSCAVDLIVPWLGTNLIQRFMWQIVAEVAR